MKLIRCVLKSPTDGSEAGEGVAGTALGATDV